MRKKGFTLMELLAVIIILGIVLLIALPILINVIDESKKASFSSSLKMIMHQIEINLTSDEELLSGNIKDLKFNNSNNWTGDWIFNKETNIIYLNNASDGEFVASVNSKENEKDYVISENDGSSIGEIPVITLEGPASLTNSLGYEYLEDGYTASDFEDGDLSGEVIVSGNVNHELIGIYELIYSVTDTAGNTASVTRTVEIIEDVKIIDTNFQYSLMAGSIENVYDENTVTYAAGSGGALPHNYVFELNHEIYLNTFSLTSYYASGYEAIGLFEIYGVNSLDYAEEGDLLFSGDHKNIADTLNYNVNADKSYKFYKLVVYDYSASNGANNTKINEVSFGDEKVPNVPTINLEGEQVNNLLIGESYIEEGYSATDSLGNDKTSLVNIIDNVNYNQVGEYYIIYELIDENNFVTTARRQINIAAPAHAIIDSLLEYSLHVGVKNYAYDGNTSTFLAYSPNNPLPHSFVFELGSSINLKKLGLYSVYTSGYDAIGSFEIYGVNSLSIEETGELLYSGNHENVNDMIIYNINTESVYKYYKLMVYDYSYTNGANNTMIKEIFFSD